MTDDMEDLNQTYPGAGNFTFGDNPKLCADLLALVRAREKTATCERLSEFDDDPAARPKVGRCDIAMNWDGTPALVIRTVRVDEVAFKDVTEEMALAEGENDDLAGWRRDHEAYFTRNGGFDENMMLLFEHFELVEDLADR